MVDAPGQPPVAPREQAGRLPLSPGVYRFRDAAGGVLYLGRAVSLRRRAASYWGDLGDRGHLAAMVARIAAVAAVRAELIRRRDTAAAALAFEFAGRVQAELEALDWITAEQKVTQAQPRDFDVHGWAEGVLIRFEVRGGRLSGWTQRLCAAAAARRLLGPENHGPAWTDFAGRTAELAAALLAC
jgi:excinuclease UvrABC nuclease subunit